ncbi:DUF1731 domain-containing protein [Streptomyces thinghirensis]|nr:DUF1731 domain-containing protein [Streptomyces thinghirensis]
MRALRKAWACRWVCPRHGGWPNSALVLRSDTELFKSRRVVPAWLREAGFAFDHPEWPEAADDLVRRVRGRR